MAIINFAKSLDPVATPNFRFRLHEAAFFGSLVGAGEFDSFLMVAVMVKRTVCVYAFLEGQ